MTQRERSLFRTKADELFAAAMEAAIIADADPDGLEKQLAAARALGAKAAAIAFTEILFAKKSKSA